MTGDARRARAPALDPRHAVVGRHIISHDALGNMRSHTVIMHDAVKRLFDGFTIRYCNV